MNWKTTTSINKRSNQKQIERQGEITYAYHVYEL